MIRNLLIIRLKQLGRELKYIGPIYFIILSLFFTVFCIYTYTHLKSFPNCFAATLVIGLIIFAIHFSRNDIHFLRNLSNKSWRIFFIEYSIICIPFFIMILFTDYWYNILIIIAMILIVSNIKLSSFKRINIGILNKFIPDMNFEWKSGVRKNVVSLLLFYIVALGLSFYQYASLISLWLMLGIIASFYFESEPLNVLLANGLNAKQFIKTKLLSHLKLYLIVILPVLFVYSIFNKDLILITIIFFILSVINFVFFILTKYSSYIPGYKQSANSIYIGIAMASVFIPILVPLPLIMCFRNYNKSVTNLNQYLDVYDK